MHNISAILLFLAIIDWSSSNHQISSHEINGYVIIRPSDARKTNHRLIKLPEHFSSKQRSAKGFEWVINTDQKPSEKLFIYLKHMNSILIVIKPDEHPKPREDIFVILYVSSPQIKPSYSLNISMTILRMPECGLNEFVVGKTYSGPLGQIELRMLRYFHEDEFGVVISDNGPIFFEDNLLRVNKSVWSIDEPIFNQTITLSHVNGIERFCPVSVRVMDEPKFKIACAENVSSDYKSFIYIPSSFDFDNQSIISINAAPFTNIDYNGNPTIDGKIKLSISTGKFRYPIKITITNANYSLVYRELIFKAIIFSERKYSIAGGSDLNVAYLAGYNSNISIFQLRYIENPDRNYFYEAVSWRIKPTIHGGELIVSSNGDVYAKKIERSGDNEFRAELVGRRTNYVYGTQRLIAFVHSDELKNVRRQLNSEKSLERKLREQSEIMYDRQINRIGKRTVMCLIVIVVGLALAKLIQKLGTKYDFWNQERFSIIRQRDDGMVPRQKISISVNLYRNQITDL